MSAPERAGASAGALVADPVPLYVDLDGTLVSTDLLWESLVSVSWRRPLATFRALLRLRHGRAPMKRALAELSAVDVESLPYNEDLLEWLRGQSRSGRRVCLATAADGGLAQRVALHLGFFADVLASDGRVNLKGPRKLEAIRRHCNGGEFDYCGNGPEDLPIFEAARRSIVVNASAPVEREARRRARVVHRFDGAPGGVAAWAKALRMHQWLKNLLVFVPLITSFRVTNPASVAAAAGAFVSFCLVASGGYLVNDLLDLASDRHHPRKRHRPLAAGRVSVPASAMVAVLAIFAGLGAAYLIAPELAAWLAGYAALTIAYSVAIKRIAIFDLLTLAALYTVRVLAGGAAIGVEVSFWLLAFSAFIFFSLATVKRCAELVSMRARDERSTRGRGYHASDLEILKSIGVSASVASVLVLALYVQTPEVAQRYVSPRALWLMLAAVQAWLAQLWLVTWRGQMHDDPLVFAVRDPTSRWLLAVMAVAFAAAALVGSR